MSVGGRPPQHPDRSGRSLAQRRMAKQIAEASKSPRMGRSGGRHSRCPSAPSCSSSRHRPKARTSVNLCWPRPATAATPPGSCQRGRWSPGAGPRPAVELQPIAVTPEPGSSSLAVPPRGLSICPQQSPTDNSVRDRPVELHHQPSVGDPRLLPKPAVPSRLVAPGRHRPLYHRQHEHADAQVRADGG